MLHQFDPFLGDAVGVGLIEPRHHLLLQEVIDGRGVPGIPVSLGAGPPPGPVVRAGAAVASRLYGLGARGRRALYARGWLTARRLPTPVVSVGNLMVGGTGKTPVVACLARLWRDRGKRVAILSRGYGGQSRNVACISDGRQTYKKPPEVGEEPYWLARTLPGVAVYTG
ncbi:MAG: tetraacyldisaccharide 4'-kinase, partial [Deltaproteobacteria bacterium]|nr:tetraacyldisaccharide 4'-kinase [Deltaproteobacteria bacterium]